MRIGQVFTLRYYIDLFVSVSWRINIHGLFSAKSILVEEKQWYYLIHSWVDNGIHIFLKGISLKVSVIA